jgi:GTP-binding protein
MKRPQVIAANKIDAIYEGDESPIDRLKAEFEPKGIKVFGISAVSGKGLKELLYEVSNMLENMDRTPIVFEQEYFPDRYMDNPDDPYTVERLEDGIYSVEGPRIEKMLGYTNLESEKGFIFFQNFMKDNGILDELENLGIQEGDTVKIYGHEFDYYK